ncbi:major facilitator superfamily domain-containing protein [Lyophyllum atratum]|nr:major facilitator superfamily domain-containing protein [Lyophyllum atratum]
MIMGSPMVDAHLENAGPPTTRSRLYDIWATPMTQIVLISLICFCCPGMYNAIGGLGGSGQLDSTVAANATVALLAATAASALTIVPPIFDMFGPRTCLLIGGWTYPLYSGALLCYNHTHNSAFVIASGAILGLGASFLWVAQGAIMVSYPLPDKKGRAIGLFWVIFNLGGGIGSFISFGLNFHSKSGTVNDGTYGAFMAIMFIGWLLSIFIAPPHKVIREDGTRAGARPSGVSIGFVASLKNEYNKFVSALRDWRIWLLIPAFFCANFFYSYQQNTVNGATFTLRARSLNGAMYWIAQMFGGIAIGFLLDLKYLTRPQRAILGYVFVLVTGFSIWGGGLAFQRWENATGKKQWLDFSDGKTYVGPFWLYFWYGAFDAFWQSYCYWMMASLADSPHEAAKYVGLYKTFQATGGAVAWRINALKYPPITQLTINWALLGASLLIAIPAVLAITPSPVAAEIDDSSTNEKDSRDEEVAVK